MKYFVHLLMVLVLAWAAPAMAQNVTINDATLQTEPDTGSTSLQFTVSLSATRTSPTTVSFATADVTATGATVAQGCGGGFDYVRTSSSVDIPAGRLTVPVYISICGDPYDEADSETFNVNLSLPFAQGGVSITDNLGVGTIIDDDDPPLISITNATMTEGNAGTTNATFNVSLNLDSGRGVRADFATANNTASGGACGAAGVDYRTTNGTVTFPALTPTGPSTTVGGTGTPPPPSRLQTITIPVCGDTGIEPNESFFVNLSNIRNARSVSTPLRARGTINNDDTPTFSVNNATGAEGNLIGGSITFTVTLAPAATTATSVRYDVRANPTTTASSAVVGLCGLAVNDIQPDIPPSGSTVSFGIGQRTANVTVRVCGDSRVEPNETFQLVLSQPAAGTIISAAAGTGVGTIQNDDSSTITR